jgi:WD40 repeat protein
MACFRHVLPLAVGITGLAFPAQSMPRLQPAVPAPSKQLPFEVVPNIGHYSSVRSVGFSPNGALVVSGGFDGIVKLWHVRTGRLLRNLFGHAYSVSSVAFMPDGMRVLSGSSDQTIKLWDAATGRLLRTYAGQDSEVTSMALSADGTHVVSGTSAAAVKLLDVASGRILRTFTGHTKKVTSVGLSRDSARIVSGSEDRLVKVWDTAAGRLLHTFEGHSDEVTSVAFSPDGTRVLSGSMDKTAKLWDVVSGKLLRTFTRHMIGVNSVAYAPDGDRVLTGSTDGAMRLWDAGTGKTLHTLDERQGFVLSVAFSADGTRIVSGRSHAVLIWDATTGRRLSYFGGQDDERDRGFGVGAIAVSPEGTRVVSGTRDKMLKTWDIATGQLLRITEEQKKRIVALAFAPDGKSILSVADREPKLKLWDVASGKLIRTYEGHAETKSVAFSKDGTRLLSVGNGSGTWVLPTDQLSPFAFIPPSSVAMLDTTTGKALRLFVVREGAWANAAAFSPDGTRVLGGLWATPTVLWDAASGKVLRTFEGFWQVRAAAFSPDGKRVLVGGGVGSARGKNSLKLWDAETGNLVHDLVGHTNSVESVAYSPDGARLLSGGLDKSVRLWDAATGHLLYTLRGHLGPVRSVAFSPDGRTIVSGSEDKTVRLWEADTGQPVATLISEYEEWVALTAEGFFAASPRGTRLISLVRGLEVFNLRSVDKLLHRPDLVRERIAGDPHGTVRAAAVQAGLRQ